jgi:hypothetical protein
VSEASHLIGTAQPSQIWVVSQIGNQEDRAPTIFVESELPNMKAFCCFSSVLSLAAALFVSGCVATTSVPYTSDAAHPIRTISIARNIEMPPKMLFYGFSEMMLAGLAAGSSGAYTPTASRQALDFYDVPQSLRAAITDELAKTGKFKVVSSGSADAELQIKVTTYGFYQAGLYARRVRPSLGVEAQLVRRDGTMVLKKLVFDDGKAPASLPEKIKADRKLGVDGLRVAARVVAGRIAEALTQ